MLKKKLVIVTSKPTKYQSIADRATTILTTYYTAPRLHYYNLLNNLKIYSDIYPIPPLKFLYLFLIQKQYPYCGWPTGLNRSTNASSKTKSLYLNHRKDFKVLSSLSYMKKKIMPFVDEDDQSISNLLGLYQTIKLKKCTTPEDLHSLILRTNVALDNLKLVYTIQLFEKVVPVINTPFLFEMLRLPLDMLLQRHKN